MLYAFRNLILIAKKSLPSFEDQIPVQAELIKMPLEVSSVANCFEIYLFTDFVIEQSTDELIYYS